MTEPFEFVPRPARVGFCSVRLAVCPPLATAPPAAARRPALRRRLYAARIRAKQALDVEDFSKTVQLRGMIVTSFSVGPTVPGNQCRRNYIHLSLVEVRPGGSLEGVGA